MKKFWKNQKVRKICLGVIIALFFAASGFFVYARLYQVMPQAAYYLLDSVSTPQKDQKILVFSPHPDDETIALGGFIYDAEKAGAKVKIVLVTDGDKHHLKDKRYSEFKEVTSTLGVPQNDLIFLNYSDGTLKAQNQGELGDVFQKEIKDFQPEIVFYPNPLDSHADHATTGKIVQDDLKKDSFQGKAYEYLVHHRRYPQPKKMAKDLYLLPPMNMVKLDNDWVKYPLSAAAVEKKSEAILKYQSQLKAPFLRSLILSSVRQNELFILDNSND